MKNAIYKNADEQHIKSMVYFIGVDPDAEAYALYSDVQRTNKVTYAELMNTWTYAVVRVDEDAHYGYGRILSISNMAEGLAAIMFVGDETVTVRFEA